MFIREITPSRSSLICRLSLALLALVRSPFPCPFSLAYTPLSLPHHLLALLPFYPPSPPPRLLSLPDRPAQAKGEQRLSSKRRGGPRRAAGQQHQASSTVEVAVSPRHHTPHEPPPPQALFSLATAAPSACHALTLSPPSSASQVHSFNPPSPRPLCINAPPPPAPPLLQLSAKSLASFNLASQQPLWWRVPSTPSSAFGWCEARQWRQHSSLKAPPPLTAAPDKYTLPSRLFSALTVSHLHAHIHFSVFPSMLHASSLHANPPAAA
ncbi:unnamed protein product [Closterium sp. Naga37s-1]|nr:unnamed protein product [Closterium sp. Naga37s-1]